MGGTVGGADHGRRQDIPLRGGLQHPSQHLCLRPVGFQKATTLAALIRGRVKVIRWTGGDGARLATTNLWFSRNASLPGNREAVWPSSPIPSNIRSNEGTGVWSTFSTAVSYSLAAFSGATSPRIR